MNIKPSALLIVLCVTSLAQKQSAGDLEPTKCSALSDYLRTGALRTGAHGSALSSVTLEFSEKDFPKSAKDVKGRLQYLKTETWKSFSECATRSYVIQRNIAAPPMTEFLSPEQMKRVDKFLARRQPDTGYIEFSCVGIDTAETQALFYVTRTRTSNAVGKWVLMERNDHSKPWVVKEESVVWIA